MATDRLSVVSFNDGVNPLVGLRRMTPEGKESMDTLIRTHPELKASGGTDIHRGLEVSIVRV